MRSRTCRDASLNRGIKSSSLDFGWSSPRTCRSDPPRRPASGYGAGMTKIGPSLRWKLGFESYRPESSHFRRLSSLDGSRKSEGVYLHNRGKGKNCFNPFHPIPPSPYLPISVSLDADGQFDDEGRPFWNIVADPDVAVVVGDNGINYGEPQACTCLLC